MVSQCEVSAAKCLCVSRIVWRSLAASAPHALAFCIELASPLRLQCGLHRLILHHTASVDVDFAGTRLESYSSQNPETPNSKCADHQVKSMMTYTSSLTKPADPAEAVVGPGPLGKEGCLPFTG